MAVPVIQDTTTNQGSGLSNLTLTQPDNVVVGELLLLLVMNENNGNGEGWDAITSESGWTQEINQGSSTSDSYIGMYWRIADGGEDATVDVPLNQTGDSACGWYMRISGINPSNAINIVGAWAASSNANVTAASVTTDADDCLIFGAYSFDGGDSGTITTSGTGWDSATDDQLHESTTSGISGAYITKEVASQGASENVAFTAPTNDGTGAIQFAIEGSSDATAPIITSPRAYDVSSTGSFLEIVTDEGNGIVYWTVSSGSNLTSTQVKAAHQVAGGNYAVSTSGTQSLGTSTGLEQKTNYWFTAVQDDNALNESNVISSSFTTSPNVLIFNSWDTVLETVLLRWNNVLGTSINTLNTAIFQGVAPTAAGSLIESIQQVTITMGSGTTGTQTFNAVDRSRSIILCQQNHFGSQRQTDTNNDNVFVLCRKYFSADNEITIERGDADAANLYTVQVQVIQFAEGVVDQIETGSIQLTGTETAKAQSIDGNSDITDWVVLTQGWEMDTDPGISGGRFGFTITTLDFTQVINSVYIRATRDDVNTGTTSTSQYAAIKFNPDILQSTPQLFEITNNSVTGSAGISSVDTSKSMIFPAGQRAATAGAGYDQYQHWQKYRFASDTSIESTVFSAPDEAATISGTVVEFKPQYINTIQTGSVVFNVASTSATATISTVATGSSIIFINGSIADENGVTPHDPETSFTTVEFLDAETLLFQRGDVIASYYLSVEYSVVEFI